MTLKTILKKYAKSEDFIKFIRNLIARHLFNQFCKEISGSSAVFYKYLLKTVFFIFNSHYSH